MYVQMLSVNAHRFLGVIGYALRWLEAAAQLDTVGVPLGVIVGDGELDGGLAGVEVEALDAQARLAGSAPDHASHVGGGRLGRHLLARAGDGMREQRLYRGDDSRVWDGAREDVLLRETLAQPRGEVHPREREREPVVVPTHHQHRHLRGGQLEQPGHLLVLLEGDRAQQFHVRVRPHHQVLDRAYGPEVPAVLREGSGESPAPGYPVDQPLGDEILERLPHRVAADAVLPAQLGLRRHPTPLPELAALQRVPQLAVEPLVRRRASPPFGPGSSSHATHNVTTRTQSLPPANGIAEPRSSRAGRPPPRSWTAVNRVDRNRAPRVICTYIILRSSMTGECSRAKERLHGVEGRLAGPLFRGLRGGCGTRGDSRRRCSRGTRSTPSQRFWKSARPGR